MSIHASSPAHDLMKGIVGRWISKPIYVAASLGIADLLSDGAKTCEELSRLTHVHADSLYRVLRALASVGIFEEHPDHTFALTPMAGLLKEDAMKPIAILFNAEWSDRTWEYFLEGIRRGETPFELAHGMPLPEWLEQHPAEAAVFNEANARKAAAIHNDILKIYDFSDRQTIMDLGGGLGVLLITVLKAFPHLSGILADLPGVAEKAERYITAENLGHRCKTASCDFFDSVPDGADTVILSNILHDWQDEACHRLLNNIRNALQPGEKILIIEMVVPEGNQPSVAKLLDMEMLATTGGRERTEAEFRDMLGNCGFRPGLFARLEEDTFLIESIRGN